MYFLARQASDLIRHNNLALLHKYLMVLLNMVELIKIIDHHPGGKIKGPLRQVRQPVDALKASTVSKVKTCDGITRIAIWSRRP